MRFVKWMPVLVAFLFLGVAFALDFDGDGWTTFEEARNGGPFLDGDADDDGVSDGWEASVGTSPFQGDTDGDGLRDGFEVESGSYPTRVDSDGDGVRDTFDQGDDCDGDGVPSVLDPDGDNDGLGDLGDSEDCVPDQDGDGILDGFEGNTACVSLVDCDFDALPDGLELDGFDPLEADSFGVGIPDGVTYLFAESGQAPSTDEDLDGIPDAWESSSGLISWGDFAPSPASPDFLVEFVRVEGPDSRDFDASFQGAYNDVVDMFAAEGISLQWEESVVRLANEPFLSFLNPSDESQFQTILEASEYGENPYVTTVLMMPGQEQTDGEILGAAHIRSMLSVIDYGAHATVMFADGNELSPVLESQMRAGNEEALAAYGTVSYETGSTYRLETTDVVAEWTPFWFGDGLTVNGNFAEITGMHLDANALASTIAHELGHTLSLCHAHERECYENFPLQQQQARHSSTMSYASEDVLHFLPYEWGVARTFLSCPPEAPLAALANGEPVVEAKYAFRGDVVRACGEFISRTPNLTPENEPNTAPFPQPAKGPRGGGWWFGLYVAVGVVSTLQAYAYQARAGFVPNLRGAFEEE